MNEIRHSLVWDVLGVRVILLPTLPLNRKSWNVLLSPTTFIHNYKKQTILHIDIDFIIKPCIIIISLFHFYFHPHDCMSLNRNDDWCPFASRSRLESRLMSMPSNKWDTTLLHTECLGTSCLVTNAAFVKCATESNNIYP